MSLWQTESWQKMLAASGQTQEYFVLEMNYNSEAKTKVFIEKRRVSLGEYGLFVIGFKGEIDERLEDNLQTLCEEENCLFAQIETIDYRVSLSSKEREFKGEVSGEENSIFSHGTYYKKFISPYTAVIDLIKSEDEILAAMKPKGRYNIRLAEKKGVRVEQVDKNPWNAKIFHTLMQETTGRDNFAGNSLSYYERFLEQEHASLLFAYHEEEAIAAGIFIQEGDLMYYYYGASGNKKRNLMAPYLLQWTAIMQAKKSGAKLYDFLGIAGPDEVNSPLAGVTEFKLKLTPDARKVSQSYIYVQKKWKYNLIHFLKKIKK